MLLPKDLRILSKERKAEIINGKVFLDFISEDAVSEPLVLVIDKSISEKHESPSALSEGKELLTNGDSGASGYPERVSSNNGQAEEQSESDNEASDNNDEEAQQRKKKKRRGPSFNSGHRKPAASKNLQSLPSCLSDYSWIENTQPNMELIKEQKHQIAERKRQREILRKQKSQEEVMKVSEEEQKEELCVETSISNNQNVQNQDVEMLDANLKPD